MLLSQGHYTRDIISKAGMSDCKPIAIPVDTNSKLTADAGDPIPNPTEYRSIAGSLQYLTFTRPDITYVVQQACFYMHDPRVRHLQALKRIIWYLQGTSSHGLQIFCSKVGMLIAYSDDDWAGCSDTRRSNSRYGVFLGDNLVS